MDKKKRKIPIAKRPFCIAAGSMLLAGAAAAGIYFLRPASVIEEQTEYTYQVSADASYRVKLHPNRLYSEEWMEEGRVYSSILTDRVEVTFAADFTGTPPGAASGDYTVTGVIEGYQETKDSRSVIYERKYPMMKGQAAADENGGAAVQAVVLLDMEQYRQAAEEADLTLGGTPARRFYLLLEGSFSSETPYGNIQEPFSLSLIIPIQKQEGFYEIPGPEPFSKTGQVTSKKEVTVPVRRESILLIGAWAVLSLALCVWLLLFTRRPDEEEIYRRQWNTLMRKHASRMVRLKQLDRKRTDQAAEVFDMDNLILISEELHSPVCCSLDERGLPEGGILYVPEGENGYILHLKEPSGTLVEDGGEESGTLTADGREESDTLVSDGEKESGM